jgi:hypothetical protein
VQGKRREFFFNIRKIVRVFSDVVKIVVLATSTNALLTVGRTPETRERMPSARDASLEGRFELHHARVNEEKGVLLGRRKKRRGWEVDVLVIVNKVVDKRAPDVVRSPVGIGSGFSRGRSASCCSVGVVMVREMEAAREMEYSVEH